jgi:hypothetical protein
VIFVRGIVQNIRNRKNPPAENPENYVKWEDDEQETDEFEKFVGGFSKTKDNNNIEGK